MDQLGPGPRQEFPEDWNLARAQVWLESLEVGAIVGVDEAGRGPLAGPVVAGACILKPGVVIPGLDDSKKISEKKREALEPLVKEASLAWGVGVATPEEIDEINILNATFLAMRRALEKVQGENGMVLVDGNHLIRKWQGNQRCVIKGDGRVLSIAAASILAKVERDRMMLEAAKTYPEYQWEKNKGYGSKAHRIAIQTHGLTPLHRKSFGFKEVQTDLFG